MVVVFTSAEEAFIGVEATVDTIVVATGMVDITAEITQVVTTDLATAADTVTVVMVEVMAMV